MIGVDSGELNSLCNTCDNYAESMRVNVNNIKEVSSSILGIFRQNGMNDIANQIETINTNYSKIVDTVSEYTKVIRKMINSYQNQEEAIANATKNSIIDIKGGK